ncbi:MAG: response regulator [Pseudomonadales bacterium]|nr:response regulator [Pseudomonadales bacterium]
MGNKVLVVEDNPDNMKLVTWILEDEDYAVTGVGSGEDCLEKIEVEAFDVILMDISLPGIDGKEVTRRLRERQEYASLPIIALTAHAIKGEDEEILASGVTDLITKPLDEEILLDRLRQLLN